MNKPLGNRVIIFACNWCDNKWERDDLDPDDYNDMDEIVYEDDVGCPLCRQKEHGFVPILTYDNTLQRESDLINADIKGG